MFAIKINGINVYHVILVVISCPCTMSCTVTFLLLLLLLTTLKWLFYHSYLMSFHLLDTVDTAGWNHKKTPHNSALSVLVLWKLVLLFILLTLIL